MSEMAQEYERLLAAQKQAWNELMSSLPDLDTEEQPVAISEEELKELPAYKKWHAASIDAAIFWQWNIR